MTNRISLRIGRVCKGTRRGRKGRGEGGAGWVEVTNVSFPCVNETLVGKGIPPKKPRKPAI